MVELQELVGKKIKITHSNGTFIIGKLLRYNTTHLFVFDENLDLEVAEPLALVSYREAW